MTAGYENAPSIKILGSTGDYESIFWLQKLVETDLIELDAPVGDYIDTWKIPETEFAEEGVTVRRLLSGSSGMPLGTIGKYYSPTSGNIPTLKENLTGDAALFREPGSAFYYSNTGFNILELMIEEVTHRDFADYMKEEVLIPLGMVKADFEWNEEFYPPVAKGYDMQGTAIPVYVYPTKAAGGLFGTLEEVAQFASAGMTGFTSEDRGILEEKTIEKMYRPVSERKQEDRCSKGRQGSFPQWTGYRMDDGFPLDPGNGRRHRYSLQQPAHMARLRVYPERLGGMARFFFDRHGGNRIDSEGNLDFHSSRADHPVVADMASDRRAPDRNSPPRPSGTYIPAVAFTSIYTLHCFRWNPALDHESRLLVHRLGAADSFQMAELSHAARCCGTALFITPSYH
ncbi:MAG: serine hydrolase domain-containing protein [Spirochaetaceae bacterium]